MARCIVSADFWHSARSASLTTQDFQFLASLLSSRICASNFLFERSVCPVLIGHVQVARLDEGVVHENLEFGRSSGMASPHCVPRSHPVD